MEPNKVESNYLKAELHCLMHLYCSVHNLGGGGGENAPPPQMPLPPKCTPIVESNQENIHTCAH